MSRSKVIRSGKTVGEAEEPELKMPERELEIVYVPLEDLTLWEKNPRKNEAAAKKLAILIKAHGFCSPITCSRDNVIRKGNTSYKAARILKMKRVPVVYLDFASEEHARLYSIGDNRAGEFSMWDPQRLAELLGERTAVPLPEMAALSGFSQPEILGIRGGDPEEEEKHVSKDKKEKVLRCPYCSKEFSLDE